MNAWKKFNVYDISKDIFCLNDCGLNNGCKDIHYIKNFNNYQYLDTSNVDKYKSIVEQNIVVKIFKSHNYFYSNNYIHLYPIITPPDGNCLFHSIAIQIYGCPDINLVFKKLLINFMTSSKYIEKIKEYWFIELMKTYKILNIELDKNTVDSEWGYDLKSIISNNCSQGALSIFLLSHIIRRPIFIISYEENELTGLYLPFMIDFSIYNKNPIFIYYSNGHFTSLMLMKKNNNKIIISNNFINVKFLNENIDIDYLSIWLNDPNYDNNHLIFSVI